MDHFGVRQDAAHNLLLRLLAARDNAAMSEPPELRWFQVSLGTLMFLVTMLAVACGTPSLSGPPFIETYREAMQQHYMPNPGWFLATILELFAIRAWFVLSR